MICVCATYLVPQELSTACGLLLPAFVETQQALAKSFECVTQQHAASTGCEFALLDPSSLQALFAAGSLLKTSLVRAQGSSPLFTFNEPNIVCSAATFLSAPTDMTSVLCTGSQTPTSSLQTWSLCYAAYALVRVAAAEASVV